MIRALPDKSFTIHLPTRDDIIKNRINLEKMVNLAQTGKNLSMPLSSVSLVTSLAVGYRTCSGADVR